MGLGLHDTGPPSPGGRRLRISQRPQPQACGEGISRQAFALQAKILQVDQWVRQPQQERVVEVHPEASFAQLAGAALLSRKSTWAGIARRRQLLAEARIVLPEDLGPAGKKAAVDDVLDAAVAASLFGAPAC